MTLVWVVKLQFRTEKQNCLIYSVVIDVDKFRKYVIKTANEKISTRNRRFIRKHISNSLLTANHNRQNDNTPPDNLITSRSRRKVTRPRRLIEKENWP